MNIAEKAHKKFVNKLKKEAKQKLLSEDLPLFFSVIRKYYLFYPVRLITVDLFLPKKFNHDWTILKASPAMLGIVLESIKMKIQIIFNEDVASLAFFFYSTRISNKAADKVMAMIQKAKKESKKINNPSKLAEQFKRDIAGRYINASPQFKHLIRQAIQNNNTPLMKDLFIRLSWMSLFSYGENALSPEIDLLMEKVD